MQPVNRPDFKELSPSLYKDPLLDRYVKGNPDLIPAYINNYDLRWDWYFDQGEFVSLGAFYKEFTDPIETVERFELGPASRVGCRCFLEHAQKLHVDRAEAHPAFGVEAVDAPVFQPLDQAFLPFRDPL